MSLRERIKNWLRRPRPPRPDRPRPLRDWIASLGRGVRVILLVAVAVIVGGGLLYMLGWLRIVLPMCGSGTRSARCGGGWWV